MAKISERPDTITLVAWIILICLIFVSIIVSPRATQQLTAE